MEGIFGPNGTRACGCGGRRKDMQALVGEALMYILFRFGRVVREWGYVPIYPALLLMSLVAH